MEQRPLLILHGIRGSRLAISEGGRERLIWQLADEGNPEAWRIALLPDPAGGVWPVDPATPVHPVDLEPDVHGALLAWARKRGPVHAPAWDWRLAPAMVAPRLAAGLPAGSMDVVVHSMGLHVLAQLVESGLLPEERIHRLALVTPACGGALDILHVLLSGCDRQADCGDATGRSYGSIVRGLPALYHLLPVPGYDLLTDEAGDAIDPLEARRWPDDGHSLEPGFLEFLLAQARQGRSQVEAFCRRIARWEGRTLLVRGAGVPTPLRCRMEGPRMACSVSRVELGVDGDGRLSWKSQAPLDCPMPEVTFGDAEHPVAHGEILSHPDVLATLTRFFS